MDKDWRECININQHLYVMTIKANKSHFYSNIMFSINTIATVLYFLSYGYTVRFVYPEITMIPCGSFPLG